MKINKISEIKRDWYSKYLTSQYIDQYMYKEAGIKENFISGIMGALILMLSGAKINDVSRRTNIPINAIEEALDDPSQVNNAKNIMNLINKPKQSIQVSPFIDNVFKYIGANEGIKLHPYKDTNGILTIGIGHKILPGEDFSYGITEDEAKQLFQKDIQEKILTAERLFPNFNSYPDYVRIALLDGVFRGEHKSSYKTTKLINEGRWMEASREYLNNNDYYRSKNEHTGVAGRMMGNAERMSQYGKELI